MLYYGMLTLVSIDLLPSTSTEILIAIFLICFGSIVIGLTITQFSTLLSQISRKEHAINEEIDYMNTFMLNMRIPEQLQNRVLTYYE